MSRVFWPCIDSNATDTVKAQKGSKDIVKTLKLVVQTYFYEAKRILLVCKESKNFIQQFILFCVKFRRKLTTVPQCMCIPLIVNSQCIQVLH